MSTMCAGATRSLCTKVVVNNDVRECECECFSRELSREKTPAQWRAYIDQFMAKIT